MRRVLVIDDSMTIRQYLRLILEQNGYLIYEASNGKEGFALFKDFSPDFIIVDVFMPEMDGIETIQRIMHERPEAKIVVISGGGSIQEMPYFEICRRFGVSCCLSKPINKDLLLSCLEGLG